MVNLQIFRLLFPVILFSLIFIGCRPKYKPEPCFETYNGYEAVIGWVDMGCNNSQSVTENFGYKGKACIHVNAKNPFGYMFRTKFGAVTNELVTQVEVSSVCKKNSIAVDSCVLVCSIENSAGEIISWQEMPLKSELIEGEWREVSHVFRIGGFSGSENRVNVLFWNHSSSQDFFVDDTKIKFYSVSE